MIEPEKVNIKSAKEILDTLPACSVAEPNLELEKKFSQLERNKNEAQILAQERLDIMGMRKMWSKWLLVVIISIVAFDFFVILAVGFEWMKFSEGYIVPFFVGESFLKTIGLALIVVGFLFNKDNILKR